MANEICDCSCDCKCNIKTKFSERCDCEWNCGCNKFKNIEKHNEKIKWIAEILSLLIN